MTETVRGRMPETPEEIKFHTRQKIFARTIFISNIILFTLILIFVPKEPNNSFFIALNSFLDNYWFGYILPEFSDRFYFFMKVAWCFSLLYLLIFIFVCALWMHFYLGREGVKIMLYLSTVDRNKHRVALFLFQCFAVVSFIYISIGPYAFGGHSSVAFLKGIDGFFYGNFIRASILFLVFQGFFSFGMSVILLWQVYHFIFCKGKFRL